MIPWRPKAAESILPDTYKPAGTKTYFHTHPKTIFGDSLKPSRGDYANLQGVTIYAPVYGLEGSYAYIVGKQGIIKYYPKPVESYADWGKGTYE